MDIDGWLRGIGLEQYAQTFRDNAIDADVLCDLTDEHLRELGLPLGARLKLLRAVAALSTGRTPVSPEITTPAPRTDAERRQVTVIFSDLVGSTALSARMDPEDLREVISAYQKCVAETVQRFGGFVAKYMGDGVLLYFGYPQAHEDDAERAVRAGLELIAAVSALKAPVSLQTRVGIATGLVVVGDLIGSGEARERGIVGETPNLAATPARDRRAEHSGHRRGHATAPWQSVRTRRPHIKRPQGHPRVGSSLDGTAGEFGGKPLRGAARDQTYPFSGPGRRIGAAASPVAGGGGRGRPNGVAVGRTGDRQVATDCGARGTASNGAAYAAAVLLLTVAHRQPLYPIISHLERAAEFERNDTMEVKLDKLSSLLGASPNHDNDVQLLAELLSIPTGGRYPPLNLSARQKKQKTIEALVRQLEVLVRQRPVLMIFEDAHWIDPSSRELLDTTIERVARLPVLLVITFRPEFHPPWTGQAHVSTLNLSRLGRREGAALAGSVAGNNVLPEEIVEEIIERTDGIPLFVEELTKAVVEARVRDGDEASTLNRVPHSALAIPATLHASLMARLDRLGAVSREVAQIGAAIGREFSYEVLAPIAQKTDMEVQTALSRLTNAELVFCRGTPPQATFLFKHALVRDVAYGSLLRGQRQQLHGRIASILEAQFPDVVESRPELLGHHFSQGGFEEKAIVYWTLAGERAVKRDANAEAIRHFGRALELLEGPPETAERRKAELRILAKLGPALQQARGFAAPEVETTYLRARELCEQLGEPHELFQALWGLWLNSLGRERWEVARPVADELLTVAQRLDDRALLLQAHHAMCPTTLWVGDPQLARTHGEQGMALYDREQHQSLAFLFGNHDPGVCCRMHSAIALWFLGYSQKAVERSRTGIAMAKELSHIGTLVNELPFAGIIHQLRREAPAVRQIAKSLIGLSTEHGFPQWLAFGKVLDSWAQAEQVDHVGLVAQLRHAIGEYHDKSELQRTYVPYFLVLLAATQLRYAESAEGLDTVVGALAMNEKRGSRLINPELYRLKGELLLASDPSVEPDAEVAFRNAIDTARRQSTKSWELRAATSLARLLRHQGKRDEARRTIAEVYEWFTEGFDTLDLKEAKALLDELHA